MKTICLICLSMFALALDDGYCEGTNVLGTSVEACSTSPMTGYFRDGCCQWSPQDHGSHTVCAEMTDDFLEYTKSMGNDLSTPHPEWGFPGLKVGDHWCLCALRWLQAHNTGHAPNFTR